MQIKNLSVTNIHESEFTNAEITDISKRVATEHNWKFESYSINPLPHMNSFFGKFAEINIKVGDDVYHRQICLLVMKTCRPCKRILQSALSALVDKGPEHLLNNVIIPLLRRYRLNTDIFVTCYLQKKEIAIYENLFNHYSFTKHYDDMHIKIAFFYLSQFHSYSFFLEKKQNIDYREKYAEYFQEPFVFVETNTHFAFVAAMVASVKEYMDLAEIKQPRASSLDAFVAFTNYALIQQEDFSKVICHGFLSPRNIAFKYQRRKPVEIKLVNFIMMRHAPPAFDIMHFLVYSVDDDEVKTKFSKYVDLYFNFFKNRLKTYSLEIESILPYEEFKVSCRIFLQIFELAKAKDGDIFSEESGFKVHDIVNVLDVLGDELQWKLDELSSIIQTDPITQEDIYNILTEKFPNVLFRVTEKFFAELNTYDGNAEYEYYSLLLTLLVDSSKVQVKYVIKTTGNYERLMPLLSFNTYHCLKSRKEIWFHEQFVYRAKRLGVPLHDYVDGQYVLGRVNDMLVFEDVDKEFSKPTLLVSMDFDMLKLIIQCFVKVHASTFLIEEKRTIKDGATYRLVRAYPKIFEESVFGTMPENVEVIQKLKKSILIKMHLLKDYINFTTFPTINETFDKFFDSIVDFVKPVRSRRNVLCHGKLWPENILLYYQRNHVNNIRIINFDSIRYSPPEQDLMSFLYTCTSRSFRDEKLSSICDYYLHVMKKTLHEFGLAIEKFINENEFELHCVQANLYGLLCVLYMLFVSFEQKMYANLFLEEKVKQTHIYDMDVSFYSNLLHRFPVYKAKMIDTLSELTSLFKTYLNVDDFYVLN